MMEFLVEFEVTVPDGTPESEVARREAAEASRGSGPELNGIFISVGGRQPGGVIYETYLVA
jgi:muconolactone delta-isomerase